MKAFLLAISLFVITGASSLGLAQPKRTQPAVVQSKSSTAAKAKSTSGGPTTKGKSQYESTNAPIGGGGSSTGPKGGGNQYESTGSSLGPKKTNGSYDKMPAAPNKTYDSTSGVLKEKNKNNGYQTLPKKPKTYDSTSGVISEKNKNRGYQNLIKKPNVQTTGGTQANSTTPDPSVPKKPSTFDKPVIGTAGTAVKIAGAASKKPKKN